MKYDPKVRTSTQAIAEKVLMTMSRNRMEERVTDAPKLRDEEKAWIPWTPETLMVALRLWDSTVSLAKVNEILDVLVTSGLIIRRDALLSHHELTSLGRAEAERLGSESS